jgi:hypothetical protein
MINGGRKLRGRYLVFEGVKEGTIWLANQGNIFWSQSASDIKPLGGGGIRKNKEEERPPCGIHFNPATPASEPYA